MSNYIVEITGFGIRKKIPSRFKKASVVFHYLYIFSFFITFVFISTLGPDSIWNLKTPYTVFSVFSVCFSSIISFLFLSISSVEFYSSQKSSIKTPLPDATSTIHLGLMLAAGLAMILTAFCIDNLSIP